MKNNIKYIILSALVLCITFTACSIEEATYESNASGGYIEFIARPTSYDKVIVGTKDGATSSSDQIENKIYNLHFLLFDNSGSDGRLIKHMDVDPSKLNASIKIDKGLSNAYACFLANVPENFANGITTVKDLEDAIYDIQEYKISNNRLGVPVIQINNQDTPCLPMVGAMSVNLSGTNEKSTETISLTRLFAKVIVNLSLNIPDDNSTTFTLNKFTLHNLPTKVALTTPVESSWIKKPNTEGTGENITTYFVEPVSLDNLSETITSGSSSAYQAACYIPEYKVVPEIETSKVKDYDESKDAQIYKPLLCPNKRPAYITFEGTMGNNLYVYSIYLGEDNHSNFNLLKNTQYTNNITITGSSEKDIDNRVSYTTMPTMLVNDESANCYMINSPGKYQLDTYRGVCKDLSSTKLKGYPFIVANDGKNPLALWNEGVYGDKIIIDVGGNGGVLGSGYIETLTGGNAVVGLNSKSDATGEWLWTWHLWFSVELNVFGNTLLSADTQIYPSGKELMDRNLGASPTTDQILTPGAAEGLYYRYGHRSPFFSSVLYTNATKYPGYKDSDEKNWNTDSKSEMDPCPPGYRVASSDAWASQKENYMDFGSSFFTYKKADISFSSGINVDLDPIYYPYSGYVYLNDENQFVQSNSILVNNKNDYIDLPIDLTKKGDKNVKNSYKFTEIQVTESKVDKFGQIICADNSLYYAKRQVDKGSTGIKYYLGTYKNILKTEWDNSVSYIMSIADFKKNFRAQYYALEAYKEILQAMENISQQEDIYSNNHNINQDYGYQVRCIIDN